MTQDAQDTQDMDSVARIVSRDTLVPLRDLGDIHPEWAGILSPLSMDEADETVQRYIHQQFLEDANVYIERYQNIEHTTELIRFVRADLPADPRDILDLGSGAGNTIFALLDLYPSAQRIVASDLSIPLLVALKQFYEARDTASAERDHRCVIMQLNAEDIAFKDEQFDLVTGGSILHHLFEPERSLAECARVLRPGGCALYFEPFEIGNQLLALCLKQVLALDAVHPEEHLSPEVTNFFKALILDYSVRLGTDKTDPFFTQADDKWLFTREHVQEMARKAGFSKAVIRSINNKELMFSGQITSLLWRGLGIPTDQVTTSVPSWALDEFSTLDTHFTRPVREELLMEGAVLLYK